jgi:hypothetical protein
MRQFDNGYHGTTLNEEIDRQQGWLLKEISHVRISARRQWAVSTTQALPVMHAGDDSR